MRDLGNRTTDVATRSCASFARETCHDRTYDLSTYLNKAVASSPFRYFCRKGVTAMRRRLTWRGVSLPATTSWAYFATACFAAKSRTPIHAHARVRCREGYRRITDAFAWVVHNCARVCMGERRGWTSTGCCCPVQRERYALVLALCTYNNNQTRSLSSRSRLSLDIS